MFSNRYIFIYSSVMVIIVAAILSAAASFLKPYQERNIREEKVRNILASADIPSTKADAEDLFQMHIVKEIVVDLKGDVLSVYENGKLQQGEVRAFEINLRKEQKIKEAYLLNESQKAPGFPLYVCEKEGKTYYIIPLRGKGLWGPLYGNIAFDDDMNTIFGANFSHDKETPGLGSEIATSEFADQFEGKTIFDSDMNFVSVKVVKGGVANSNINISHGVDAISGGTITSNGVTDMIEDCLGNYIEYIKKQK